MGRNHRDGGHQPSVACIIRNGVCTSGPHSQRRSRVAATSCAKTNAAKFTIRTRSMSHSCWSATRRCSIAARPPAVARSIDSRVLASIARVHERWALPGEIDKELLAGAIPASDDPANGRRPASIS